MSHTLLRVKTIDSAHDQLTCSCREVRAHGEKQLIILTMAKFTKKIINMQIHNFCASRSPCSEHQLVQTNWMFDAIIEILDTVCV